ncbi:MAG: hypothetical protein NVSMB27_29180 [Ktedonobacteraceae bacterium]
MGVFMPLAEDSEALPSMVSRRERLAVSTDGTNIYAIAGLDQLLGVWQSVEYSTIPCQGIQNLIDTLTSDLQTIESNIENIDEIPANRREAILHALIQQERRLQGELISLQACCL